MKRILGWICSGIATLGPVGYLPAPGTFGTLCAIPLLWAVRRIGVIYGISQLILILSVIALAFFVIKGALIVMPEKDPQQIVIDEVAGFFIAMYLFPFKIFYLVFAFCIFRLADIEKPFGIDVLEGLPGAWGVMCDDLAAGALTVFFLAWIVFFLENFGFARIL